MSEPKAITYKEVGSPENWRKICDITGAGIIPLDADGDASIDLTGAPDAVKAKVDALVSQKQSKKDGK